VPGLTTLTANDAELDFMRFNPTLTITREPVGGTPMTIGLGNDTSEAMGISGGKLVGVINLGPGGAVEGYHAFAMDVVPAYADPTLVGSMLEVAVDEDGDWYGVAGGASVHHFKAGTPDIVGSIGNRQPSTDLAVANRTLFVAMAGAARGIYMIPRDKVTDAFNDPPIVPQVLPRSIAARKSFLYYVEGTSLWRVDITTLKPPVLVTTVALDARSLTADEGCVYWIENGGKRIMRHRAY
jgi:hypothetical protein